MVKPNFDWILRNCTRVGADTFQYGNITFKCNWQSPQHRGWPCGWNIKATVSIPEATVIPGETPTINDSWFDMAEGFAPDYDASGFHRKAE